MAKVGSYFNNSAHAINVAATNAYVAAQRHALTNLGGTSTPALRAYFLRTLYVQMDTLAGLSATPSLTIRLCRDTTGDQTIVGDVTASLSLGITDATDGSITVAIDFAYSYDNVANLTNDTLYIFWKLDQGTGQVRRIELTCEE